MRLKALTDGKVTGNGSMAISGSQCFGGCLISSNGSDAVSITVTDLSGVKIFDISTPIPGFAVAPIVAAQSGTLTYEVSGTGGFAQFYVWIP